MAEQGVELRFFCFSELHVHVTQMRVIYSSSESSKISSL
jgi:hypothetical protein